jgi:hypothetical protein
MSMDNNNENYIETIEGDCILRVYKKYTVDGGFGFTEGSKATWKKKSQWVFNLHSFNDQPAVEYPSGYKEWFKEGRQHRDSGPSIINSDGSMAWFKEGRHLHDDPDKCPVFYPEGWKHANPEKDCFSLNPNKIKCGVVDYMPPCCQAAFLNVSRK